MIKINKLNCSYSEQSVIEDLNLEIDEHICILGANGSGKSTLAKALSNLISFEGNIFIGGKNISELKRFEISKLITYVPSKMEFFDAYISVFEYVLQGRYVHKNNFAPYSAQDIEKVADILEQMSITHLKDKAISELSSGESQLVLIAQNIVQESKVIIFDEPTANLDPTHSYELLKEIKKLKSSHLIILITHDVNLAFAMESSILFISGKEHKYFKEREKFFTKENLFECYKTKFSVDKTVAIDYD